MEAREQKGLQIAKEGRIRQTPRGFLVPSQSGSGSYLVYKMGATTACTCKDCETRGIKCKHQFAVEHFIQKTIDSEGNTTITKAIRMTYPQNWKAYNKSQTSEITMFDRLLSDLVNAIPEPPQARGRPRLSLQEQVFCAIQKVYSQLSSRRAHSLYRNAEEREQIGKAPNFNAINKILNKEELKPILERLLVISASPLKSIETTFAPDSSGFSTSHFTQYANEKYGLRKKHGWVKAHIIVGTKTNVIVGAKVTDDRANDCPQFEPLVMEAHGNGFNVQEVVADMGYSSRENYKVADSIGAMAYIPFKKNATGKSRGSCVWRKAWLYFQLNQEEFLEHYHARSNVESAFMAIKAKFGDRLKSKNFMAQQNELLCKFIAYNVVVLIHEMNEIGIETKFKL